MSKKKYDYKADYPDWPRNKKYRLSYYHNNSGGEWWLGDKDWKNLEKVGWIVEWCKDDPSFSDLPDGRWLGALATQCYVYLNSKEEIKAWIDRWSKLTKQNPADEGCNCCGKPHRFTWQDKDGGYDYLQSKVKTSIVWDNL